MKKKRSDDARHIEGWQSKNERIESLLNVLYDFRFNTVKSRTEYRAASSSGLYQRKKGTSHTGILQRPAASQSNRTRAYRQAPEHGTGSQPWQMGGIFHEMAYRCGSQRDERHGVSESYLSGADRGQAGTV